MNLIAATLAKLATVGILVVTAASATGCYAGVEDPAYYPPDGFIATSTPVYYEGRPAYLYRDHWYYRDGARWGYYRNEPHFLAQHRGRVAPHRSYERRR